MTYAILLDSGPLGKMVHQERTYIEPTRLLEKFAKDNGISLLIPEIIEMELKKELVNRGFVKSIRKLNKFGQQDRIIKLTQDDRLLAKEIENNLRKEGKSISKEIPSNDGILAAQAINLKISQEYEKVIILTENIKHITKLVKNDGVGVIVWDYEILINNLNSNIETNILNVKDLILA
jgi:predicted nucleic acid-binding protein